MILIQTGGLGSSPSPPLLLLLLMFIGASPGSTGGGVKTTSAALLVMLMWNRLKGSVEVNIFNRAIPTDTDIHYEVKDEANCCNRTWNLWV